MLILLEYDENIDDFADFFREYDENIDNFADFFLESMMKILTILLIFLESMMKILTAFRLTLTLPNWRKPGSPLRAENPLVMSTFTLLCHMIIMVSDWFILF